MTSANFWPTSPAPIWCWPPAPSASSSSIAAACGGGWYAWGHILLAKLIELLRLSHRVPPTDRGCTYLLLWLNCCYKEIEERAISTGRSSPQRCPGDPTQPALGHREVLVSFCTPTWSSLYLGAFFAGRPVHFFIFVPSGRTRRRNFLFRAGLHRAKGFLWGQMTHKALLKTVANCPRGFTPWRVCWLGPS
jgi:hypothetical protein